MKKRSVLAVASLAAGAVIAAISPPPGADTAADTKEPAHAAEMVDDLGEAERWVDSDAPAPGADSGVVAPDISSTQGL
ncbi:hypothetical protein [Streptomyces sp. NPDC055189]